MEIMVLSILGPTLICEWNISTWQSAFLTTVGDLKEKERHTDHNDYKLSTVSILYYSKLTDKQYYC